MSRTHRMRSVVLLAGRAMGHDGRLSQKDDENVANSPTCRHRFEGTHTVQSRASSDEHVEGFQVVWCETLTSYYSPPTSAGYNHTGGTSSKGVFTHDILPSFRLPPALHHHT